MRSRLSRIPFVVASATALVAATFAAAAPAHAAHRFECTTRIDTERETGSATCKNTGDRRGQFRVWVLCSWGPDRSSSWVAVAPGQTATTIAGCAPGPGGPYGTSVEDRPA